MPPRGTDCEHHQTWLEDHEKRIRHMEISHAGDRARMALFAALGAMIGNAILGIVAAVVIYYVTKS